MFIIISIYLLKRIILNSLMFLKSINISALLTFTSYNSFFKIEVVLNIDRT